MANYCLLLLPVAEAREEVMMLMKLGGRCGEEKPLWRRITWWSFRCRRGLAAV